MSRRLCHAFLVSGTLLLGLAGCGGDPADDEAAIRFQPVEFSDLTGWEVDAPDGAMEAFRRSCSVLFRRGTAGALSTTPETWRPSCEEAARGVYGPETARSFFERHFTPVAVNGPDGAEGLFTAYYEAELRGARAPDARFRHPVRRPPDDLLRIDLSDFGADLPRRSLFGRIAEGRVQPYFDRAAIASGALAGQDTEILWVDDALDLFLLHIQGSGRVILPDGAVLRVGFAAHNSRPYRSIGRVLIERGALQPGQAGWPQIRDWLDAHPDKLQALLNENPRYIFFNARPLEDPTLGPMGALGLPLTPLRSLAVDPELMPLGAPVWVSTHGPGEDKPPLQRLMLAQDVGGAIKGAVRGDIFWGYGNAALEQAGRMQAKGRYFVLMPKAVADSLAQE